jgi:hypothetical protein
VTRLIQRVDPARADQKSGCNPLTFFTKKTFFLLKKKRIDPDYPVTQSKLEIRILDRAGSKNDGVKHSIFVSMK